MNGKPNQDQVSIRSPHRSKGRLKGLRQPELIEEVSIRSPHRSKGRPAATNGQCSVKSVFQSAPLTEARGDENE